jgi:TetR/AcrR family transcriptional regulator, cholesterol catabolism regulator
MTKRTSRRPAASNGDAESRNKFDRKRDEIIGVAAMLFNRKGYKSTSLEDIGRQLGLDRASLYYYVKSKKSILDEITEGAPRVSTARIEEIAAGEGSAKEKLLQVFAMQMASYDRHYPSLQIYTQVLLQDMMPIGGGRKSRPTEGVRYYNAMRSILDQGFRAGEFHSDLPAGLVTMAVIGALNWSYRWYKPGGALDAEDIGRGFARIIINGLRPRTTSKKRPAPAAAKAAGPGTGARRRKRATSSKGSAR